MRHLIQEFGPLFFLVPIAFFLYNRNRNKTFSKILNSEGTRLRENYVGRELGNPFYVPYLFLFMPLVIYLFFVVVKELDQQTSMWISLALLPVCLFLAHINGKKYRIGEEEMTVIPFIGKTIAIKWTEITNINLRIIAMRSGGTGWVMDIYSNLHPQGLSTIKSDVKDSDILVEFLKYKRPDLKLEVNFT